MKKYCLFPVIVIQKLNKKMKNFSNGGFLGEELISVYHEAGTAGLKNWNRKIYRSYL